MSDNQPEPTLEQRKVIYRARRGLKELDYYFDPYVRADYLQADSQEQQIFAELVKCIVIGKRCLIFYFIFVEKIKLD